MKNIRVFLSEIFQFSVVTFSIYLNMRVFLMSTVREERRYEQLVYLNQSSPCENVLYWRIAKIQSRLCGCAGWSESLLLSCVPSLWPRAKNQNLHK